MGTIQLLLVAFGMVLILEGIPWFLSPSGVRRMLAELAKFPETTLRLLGLLAMFGGLLLVWAGRA